MSENTALAIFVSGFFICVIAYWVVLPMFNAYLEYRRDIRLHEQDMAMYEVQRNEKGLQRNNDDPDIKQRSGKSDEGTSLHDEELSL